MALMGKERDGPLVKALRKHEVDQLRDIQRIQEWRKSFYHVAEISGLELEAFNM